MKEKTELVSAEPASESRSRLLQRVALLALGCSPLIVLFSIFWGFWRFHDAFGDKFEEPDLRKISKATRMHFPRGARLIDSHMVRHWDTWKQIHARFVVPRDQISALVDAMPRQRDSSRSDRYTVTNDHTDTPLPEWWNPDSVEHFLAVQAREHEPVSLLIEENSSDHATVYLEWKGTTRLD